MIIGHKKQWDYLESSFENEQMAHAYLFCGENQIGKKTLAIEFVKLLNCQGKDKPCEVCKNCIDIEKGNFLDFLFVRTGEESINFDGMFSYNSALPDLKSGEVLTDKKEIGIDQARKAINFLSLRSYFDNYKAVIIDNAEKLTTESQNCLLKTLEEPKGKTVLILVTSLPDRLLSTIISRCQMIKFFPVPAKEIQQNLMDIKCPLKNAQDLADIADGKPGVAFSYFKNPDKLEQEKTILSNLIKIINQNLAEKFQYAKNLKEENSNIKEILEILQKYFRYLLLRQNNIIKDDKLIVYSQMPKIAKNYSLEKLIDIIKLVDKLINKLSTTNVSPKLALEILFLEL